MDSAASHLCVYCLPLDIVLEYLHCTRVNIRALFGVEPQRYNCVASQSGLER